MRTIKNLINENKKVYIFLKDEETRVLFSLDCEKEGITFSDKVPASKRKLQDVMALLPDSTICYIGFAGRMCYKNGGEGAIRIDYKDYKSENENYIVNTNNI